MKNFELLNEQNKKAIEVGKEVNLVKFEKTMNKNLSKIINENKKQDSLFNEVLNDLLNELEKTSLIDYKNNDVETITTSEKIKNVNLINYAFKISADGSYIHIVNKFNHNIVYGGVSLGNDKLIKDNKNNMFIIFNTIQILTCLGATVECKHFCYTNKQYNTISCFDGSTCIFRSKNTVLTMYKNFNKIILDLINFVKNTLLPNGKTIVFRIHESGDFYDILYINKFISIFKEVDPKLVKFKFFTKSYKMLENLKYINLNFKNVIGRYSVDESTKGEVIDYILKNEIHTFGVVPLTNNIDFIDFNKNCLCNMTSDIELKNEVFNNIKSFKNELKNEVEGKSRITYIQSAEGKIRKENKKLVKKSYCHSCFKCFNKNVQHINVLIH